MNPRTCGDCGAPAWPTPANEACEAEGRPQIRPAQQLSGHRGGILMGAAAWAGFCQDPEGLAMGLVT